MLNEEEKKFIKEIFFKQDFSKENLKAKEKQCNKDEITFWKTLYNFIFQYRTSTIEENDPFIDYWLYEVAPSCTYPSKPDETKMFCCVFCDNQYSRTGYIVRHYKEKHSNDMPSNIFGMDCIKCEACNVKFSRKENYKLHLQSLKHKMVIDPTYIPDDKEAPVNHNKAKRQNEIEQWESKRPKLIKQHSNEQPNEENSSLLLSDTDLLNDKIISNRDSLKENFTKPNDLSDSGSCNDEISKIEEKFKYMEECKNFQEIKNDDNNKLQKNDENDEGNKSYSKVTNEITNEESNLIFSSNDSTGSKPLTTISEKHENKSDEEEVLSQKIKKSLSFHDL